MRRTIDSDSYVANGRINNGTGNKAPCWILTKNQPLSLLVFVNYMSMPEQQRSNKRKKCEKDSISAEVTGAADDIIRQLPKLRRAMLEKAAAAAILSSSVAAQAAADSLRMNKSHDGDSSDNHFQHCVRCHEDFDPDTAGPYDCIMEEHDENNGMIEVGTSGLNYMYPCCHQEDDDGPCWTGSHLVSWEEAEVTQIDQGQTYTKLNDGGYWKDQELALKWNSRANKSICFECSKNGDDDYPYEPCADCCTCGKAQHHES